MLCDNQISYRGYNYSTNRQGRRRKVAVVKVAVVKVAVVKLAVVKLAVVKVAVVKVACMFLLAFPTVLLCSKSACGAPLLFTINALSSPCWLKVCAASN